MQMLLRRVTFGSFPVLGMVTTPKGGDLRRGWSSYLVSVHDRWDLCTLLVLHCCK